MSHRWSRALCVGLVSLFVTLFADASLASPGRLVSAVQGGSDESSPKQLRGFAASEFEFKVVNKDDGTGPGGGWQQAVSTLRFVDWRGIVPDTWTCPVKVGMPLRTEIRGKISADRAAQWAAEVATEASKVIHTKPEWVPADFCNQWRAKMRSIFRSSSYEGVGARVEE